MPPSSTEVQEGGSVVCERQERCRVQGGETRGPCFWQVGPLTVPRKTPLYPLENVVANGWSETAMSPFSVI